jgi:hypothetical protein
MDSMKILCEIPFKDKTITELDVSGKNLGTEGALVVAEYLDGNGAMTSLNLASNGLYAEGTKLLAAALKGNQIMTELDISSNYQGGISGVDALANVIPDMGAILSVNLLKNEIKVKQARTLVAILKEHPTLKSLCGNNGDETELDMSGKMNGAEDVIMLVAEIIDNGALLVLSLQSNNLWADCGEALAEGLKGNRVITELNIGGNNLGREGRAGNLDTSGVTAITSGIQDMRAISLFTFSGERSYDSGNLEGAAAVTRMETSMTEADFSGEHLGISGAIMLSAFLPKCM